MRREYLSGLGALNFSMSFSREIRNFKKGLFWSLQLCAMPSNNKYLEAPFSQKIADIFLCIAILLCPRKEQSLPFTAPGTGKI